MESIEAIALTIALATVIPALKDIWWFVLRRLRPKSLEERAEIIIRNKTTNAEVRMLLSEAVEEHRVAELLAALTSDVEVHIEGTES